MSRVLILVCLAVALAGCGGSSGETPATSGLGGPSAAPGETKQFTLPSRNIGCLITAESARCDIDKKQWKPPAKPADCQGSWGSALTVTTESAALTCASDSVMGSKEILAYGKATQVGEFVCTSASAGVRCTHAPTGRGFTLAREAYTTF